MNYSAFKFTENDNGFYFYFISPFSQQNIDFVAESIEHYISNEPTEMNKYLHSVDFDNVKVEPAVGVSVMDIINKQFAPDPKCMNISQEYVSLIPAPKPRKEKKEPKPKAEKAAKPRGKKSTQKVEISVEPTTLSMNQ